MGARNQNRPATLEFAVRHAMGILGAAKVAKVLGCSTSQLYKATQANPTRALPDPSWSRICRLVAMLNNAEAIQEAPGTAEHFTEVLRAQGKVHRVPSLDIHRCMSHATACVGAFARQIIETTHKRQPDVTLTIDDLSRVSLAGRQAIAAISTVIAVCDHHARSAATQQAPAVEVEEA